MPVIFTESFDGQALTDTLIGSTRKWGAGSGVTMDAAGRTGQGIKITTLDGRLASKSLVFTGDELVAGAAVKPGGFTALNRILAFSSTDAFTTTFEMGVRINTDGRVAIIRGGAGSVASVAVSADVIFTDTTTFKYVEFRHLWHATTGIATVRVNGVQVASFTGDTRQSGGGARPTLLTWGGTGDTNARGVVGTVHDDIYILSANGGGLSSFLGDTKVRCIRPNGNGDLSQFIGSDGNSLDNYLLVDEQTINDADYVESTADADEDTYAFENPTITGGIAAVAIHARCARLSEADPKTLNLISRLGTTEATSPITLAAAMSLLYGIQESKPGGGEWTSSDLNSAQFGYEQVDA